MLSPASWLPKAQALRLGDRARVDHDCGAGRTLTVEHSPDGYKGFCYRCNDRGWAPPAPVPLAERLARLKARQDEDNKHCLSVALPQPMVRAWDEWPAAAQMWLLKAGLTRADLPGLGAYYHPPTNRVVLPVLGPSGAPVFWQARSIDGRLPKYLAPPVDKRAVVPRFGSASAVTLTEDLLSAYKVGLVAEGWSLLGTSISPACLSSLVVRGSAVNVWLDPDAAGNRAATKVLAALRAAGLTAHKIVSERDPKLMWRSEINQLLGE